MSLPKQQLKSLRSRLSNLQTILVRAGARYDLQSEQLRIANLHGQVQVLQRAIGGATTMHVAAIGVLTIAADDVQTEIAKAIEGMAQRVAKMTGNAVAAEGK